MALVQGSAATKTIARGWAQEVRFAMSISHYAKPILTVTPAAADKVQVLRRACIELGLTPHQVIAFGDAENDIEMFGVSGFSFAMGQADSAVKRAARVVAPRAEEDGVAQVVERLLAEGEPFLGRAATASD